MSRYLTDLIPLYQRVTAQEGRTIAHDLTVLANDALLKQASDTAFPQYYHGSDWERVARSHPLAANMVSDPLTSLHAFQLRYGRRLLRSGK